MVFLEFRVDELVFTIKNELFTRGYTYEHFLSLDSQMHNGSRQLLICLGWLIYHMKLMELCIESCLNSDCLLDYDDTSSLYQSDEIDAAMTTPHDNDLIGQVKQAMHVNSKLRFSLRRLHGLVIENTSLQHQVREERVLLPEEISVVFRYTSGIICPRSKRISASIRTFSRT